MRIIRRDIKREFFHARPPLYEVSYVLQLVRHYSRESRQRDSDIVITSRIHRSYAEVKPPRGLMFHRLIRRWFFNPRYNKVGLHSSRGRQGWEIHREAMVLFAFSLTRKRSTPSGRNGFVLPLRSPANLIPCPYVPRIANEPSTRPITVHCETSKTLSNNHLRVPPSYVTPLPPFHLVVPHHPHSSRNPSA